MRSDKQIEPSRRNGALSHGPFSIDGKAASSRNSTTHGLNARDGLEARDGLSAHDVLLRHESLDHFEQLLQHIENHVSRYSHATDRTIRRLQHLRKLAPPAAPLQFPTNEPKEL